MATQTVPYSIVPHAQPVGVIAAFTSQGHGVSQAPDGWLVDDAAAFLEHASTFVGSATELSWNKTQKQTALHTLFIANFDLAKFIDNGTKSDLTAANVGTFIATIANNLRSLKAQIAAAPTVTALNAIDINSGWPNNP